jgi:hypothetical protein
MHIRRLLCFLLGMWLAGGFFMAYVATENFRGVDRLLVQPNPTVAVEDKTLGREAMRGLLRYQVSEQNRRYFQTWEVVQLAGGLSFLFLMFFAAKEGKFSLGLALGMLVIVALQRFLLTPQIVSLGREIDFIPAGVASPARNRFWVLHGAYTGVELLKWVLGLTLAAKLCFRARPPSGEAGQEFDLIDKANHRHVNR